MKTTKTNDPFNAMQQAFASFAKGGAPMRAVAEQYWRNQERVLASAEEFTRGWFARRHDATRTATEAACNICDAHSPAEAMQECQSWMQHSMERVTADALDFQKHVMTVVESAMAAARPEGEADPAASSTRSESRPRAA